MIRLPWIASAALAVYLLVVSFQLHQARAQRDVARREIETLRVQIDVQEVSIREVTAASQRMAADVTDTARRCDAALLDHQAAAQRLRVALRHCKSAEALSERAGALFP